MTRENLIRLIERHCNNYFNERNNQAAPERDYPEEFLELVDMIAAHLDRLTTERESGGAVSSISEADYSVHFAADPKTGQSWQTAFANDLSVFKRVKFI